MSRSDKSIWSLAIEERDRLEKEREGDKATETSIIFVGNKNAGKTTIILRFLEREEPPKPTVALEYTYGRKQARGSSMGKNIAHIWELGGGTSLTKLLDSPINENTIRTISLAIVVDLSRPHELFLTLETLLKELRTRVKKTLAHLSTKDARVVDKMKKAAWKKYGEDHPDRDLLDLFPIPLVILGTKYDIVQDFDSEKRKVICKLLRFIAHTNGATLQFCSVKSSALVSRCNGLISSLVFGTSPSRFIQVDPSKPLLVPAGSDSLGSIGAPLLPSGDISHISAKNPYELWKQSYTGFFPQEMAKPQKLEDPSKDPQFKEPAVDAMRAQKNEELERYRRVAERKAREAARLKSAGIVT
ncbi:cytoplasmic dynein 2 light intermediate chain 1-like [Corticium candelabrum]|uniref:cytoplasmic dynein 2 light intermediate chain 1-like n=1 Tax=Corticium candelabrum TaxID=121492 RepID=UPI002E253969|nr:cytoplasmic dynein 2 light intermediate chain 1-like [Corticium candelabrum]